MSKKTKMRENEYDFSFWHSKIPILLNKVEKKEE